MHKRSLLHLCLVSSIASNFVSSLSFSHKNNPTKMIGRKNFLAFCSIAMANMPFVNGSRGFNSAAFAFAPDKQGATATVSSSSLPSVAYKQMKVNLPQFGVDVPVAAWYSNDDASSNTLKPAMYSHRISVKKIGSMLARMNFIPAFAAKDFTLSPTTVNANIVDGNSLPFPTEKPVVILAHGFLGSRFDLSHLGEELARQGFVCFSPEYPESLASSYNSIEGLDRSAINDKLIKTIESDLGLKPKSYGIVGHSLGCGTALTTGDDSWTRVCIAGPPARRDGVPVGGSTLAITSLNDGLVTLSRLESMIPSDFVKLREEELVKENISSLPSKAILIFDRPDAPNHISYLTGSVNDSMVSFLSPLLPVAQALEIPVLDFDKYKESQDSVATANIVIPLVSNFLKQKMIC